MFESLLEQIPASVAIVLLVLMVSFNFFFGVIRLIYTYFTKKNEITLAEQMEEKVDGLVAEMKDLNKAAMERVDNIEKTANDATAQIGIILAHYDSEVKFRKMLENQVNDLSKKIDGNGRSSMITEIELLKQKLEVIEAEVRKISEKSSE